MDNASVTALESFLINNSELEKLERLLGQFNVFEAIGAVRHELRHSDFLGFLLDPNRNHGLGDEFVRLFLQKVLSSDSDRNFPFSLIDLALWSFEEIEVYREWQNIDILLIDNTHGFVVIIENKIGSSEHSDQLQRYRKTIEDHFPNSNALGIFLTPEGEKPSDDTYISVSYSTICEIVENIAEKRASTIGTDIRTLMIHYTQMLRRHIMNDSEIAELCRRIYKKHRQALDLIFEHRPDRLGVIRDILVKLINNEPLLRVDTVSKTLIRFTATGWDVPLLLQSTSWTKSNQILLFEFYIKSDELNLILYLGPGPENVRQAILDLARADNSGFSVNKSSLGKKWKSLYRKPFLKPKDFEGEQDIDLENLIEKSWNEFVKSALPKLLAAVRNDQQLWEIKI